MPPQKQQRNSVARRKQRARERGAQVRLTRAIHERLSSGQFLHLPVHTLGEVEKDLGTTLRVRFIPEGELLHPPTSPRASRLAGDRIVSVTCIVARDVVREVEA
jgi:hypothetical protein